MDNGFGPNVDSDAISVRIKKEGLLMVFDIPTGSSSGVEMDNGFGPNVDSDAISVRIKKEGLVQTWIGKQISLMVFDIPTGSSSGVEMDNGFGPYVDSGAISARIKEEGLVQTWTGMQISVVDGGGFGANVDRDAKLMVFDIPTGSSSGVEMDNRFCPNVDTDAILARIKEEGLLMVFDIPTGSSSGVEMDNGFCPNIDSDVISVRIKKEGLVQTWIGMQISLMVFDIPTGSSSGVEMDYGFGPNVDSDAISARIKDEGLVQTWIGMEILLMVFDIPTGSSSGVEMDYGFGPNVDSDAISVRIKKEGLVQTWIGMQISVVDGGGFGANVDRDAKLMVFDIPTGSSSGVEMDNRFCPNVDTDAILARIKEEGLLMVFDIPTGSSSGVEMDNGFCPNIDSDVISVRIKEGLVQTWIGMQISLMVFDIPTGSSSGVEMDYGFGPNVDSDAISARIKEEGLVQTWIGMEILWCDFGPDKGGGFGANVDRDAKLMVFDIPTGSSSGVEMDNRFCPNVDTDAILARIKEEGLLMVFDIPTGSSSGVEIDNGVGPNVDSDAILARIKEEEGLLMGFDIPTGLSSGVEVEYILTDKTETLTGKKMIFRSICINGIFYGNETGDALKGIESLSFPFLVSFVILSDLLYKIKVGVLFLFQSQSTNRMKRFVYVKDDESSASQDLYCDNHISNRKYSVLNFIPKNLWEQFSRFMNQYFLLIACLQLWSLITPVNPASTWACKYMGSFIFIFAVSASKEAWGDCNRYLSDKKQTRNKSGLLDKVEAQDIHVRNIVWLRENDEVPCDLVLIGTSDPLGLCYIETAALDGETDLKTRSIPSTCMGIPFDLLYKIKGVIECPKPDKDIRRFDANLRLFPPFIDNDVCPLTIKNTLLQSCYLRNTEWACGVAIYTEEEESFDGSKRVDPDCQSSCPGL
ncbi:hypothetical protein ACFE04_024030 [Oxalis oulophora]